MDTRESAKYQWDKNDSQVYNDKVWKVPQPWTQCEIMQIKCYCTNKCTRMWSLTCNGVLKGEEEDTYKWGLKDEYDGSLLFIGDDFIV